jgi:hypothetical protein
MSVKHGEHAPMQQEGTILGVVVVLYRHIACQLFIK